MSITTDNTLTLHHCRWIVFGLAVCCSSTSVSPAQEIAKPELVEQPLLAESTVAPPADELSRESGHSPSLTDLRGNGRREGNSQQRKVVPNQRELFGNTPDDLGSQLRAAEEDTDSLLPFGPLTHLHNAWLRCNQRTRDATGLDIGLNYTTLYQRAAEGSGPRDAAAGDIDFFGEWNLLGRNGGTPGFFAFSSEVRDAYSSIPPSRLGSSVGSAFGTAVGFNTQDFALVQLYWEHGSIESGARYRIGRMDPALVYDGGRYVSSNYAFLSPAFSDTAPMPLPGAGNGVVGAVYPTQSTYVAIGVHNANGVRTQGGFNTFFDTCEYFTALEFGVFPGEEDDARGLWHLTLWHIDARETAGRPSDYGIALTIEQEIGERGNVVPFLRYAYADRGLNPIRQNVSIGLGLEDVLGQNEDLIGVAFGWGMPSDRSLKSEYVFETFYRIVITPHTHVTPDLSVIIDPANAPSRDSVALLGLRLRTLF